MKLFSGFTSSTAENLLLDAGAFFKNFDPATDTFESAVAAGKLIGATRGGGKFTAKPAIRSIEVDGVKGEAKGLVVIDEWETSIEATVLEVSKTALQIALTAPAPVDTSDDNYDIITAKNQIELSDYIDNITYIGKLAKSERPLIIQIFNALNKEGLSFATKDKDEAVIALKFSGTYDPETLNTPPFKIYYPK